MIPSKTATVRSRSLLVDESHLVKEGFSIALVRCDVCQHEQEESGHREGLGYFASRGYVWRRRAILPYAKERDDGEEWDDTDDADDSAGNRPMSEGD